MHVDARDPGFQPGRWRCLLNGRDVTDRTVAADDERGYVLLQVRGENGAPVINSDGSRHLATAWGHVHIVDALEVYVRAFDEAGGGKA